MSIHPSIIFHKGHGTDGEEHVHEGIETTDKGFIGIGHTQDQPEKDTTDILIIKTDRNGELLWKQKIGRLNEWDTGIAITETYDGYIAVGGESLNGTQKPAAIKLSKSGDIVWKKIFDVPGIGLLRGVDIDKNGNIAVTGFHRGSEEGFVFISDESVGFASLLSSSGEVIWQESYKQIPQGTKILSTSKDNFAILSTIWNDEDKNNAAILNINSSGEQNWFKNYGGGNNQAFDFALTPDSGFVLAGHTNEFSSVNWDGLMTKVDANGNLLWRKIVGQPRGYDARYIHDEFYGIIVDPDGFYVMAGGSGDETRQYEKGGHPSGPSGEWKAYIVRISPEGNVAWENVYGDGPGEGHNAAEFLDATHDGGYILFNDSDTQYISDKEPNNFGFMKIKVNHSGKNFETLYCPKKFNKKNADRITNFDPASEELAIDTQSFGINQPVKMRGASNKKRLKYLAQKNFDFLYDQKKGGLYFNENGSDKGFGDGGIIAILKGAPDLTLENIDFL